MDFLYQSLSKSARCYTWVTLLYAKNPSIVNEKIYILRYQNHKTCLVFVIKIYLSVIEHNMLMGYCFTSICFYSLVFLKEFCMCSCRKARSEVHTEGSKDNRKTWWKVMMPCMKARKTCQKIPKRNVFSFLLYIQEEAL